MNRRGLRPLGADDDQQCPVPLNDRIRGRHGGAVLRERATAKSSRQHGADDQSKYPLHSTFSLSSAERGRMRLMCLARLMDLRSYSVATTKGRPQAWF